MHDITPGCWAEVIKDTKIGNNGERLRIGERYMVTALGEDSIFCNKCVDNNHRKKDYKISDYPVFTYVILIYSQAYPLPKHIKFRIY